jgi:hypothetical protein
MALLILSKDYTQPYFIKKVKLEKLNIKSYKEVLFDLMSLESCKVQEIESWLNCFQAE